MNARGAIAPAIIRAATYRLLALIAELDRREVWADQGALSCAHWLSWACGIDTHTAREKVRVARALTELPLPASCITFLSEQAFALQNTRFWSRSRVWFQFTVGEDKPPMLSVDNRGKGVLRMDCSAKRSPL